MAAVDKYLEVWKHTYDKSKSKGYLDAIKNVMEHVKDFLVEADPATSRQMIIIADIKWNQELFTAFYTYLITTANVQANTAEFYTHCLVAYLYRNTIDFSIPKNRLKAIFRAGNVLGINHEKAIAKARDVVINLEKHKRFYKLVDRHIATLPAFDKALFDFIPVALVGQISYQQGLRPRNMLVPDKEEELEEFMGGITRGTKKVSYVFVPDNSLPWQHYDGTWKQFENVDQQELYFKDKWIFEKTPKNPTPKNFIIRTSLIEEKIDSTYPFKLGIKNLSERYTALVNHWKHDAEVKKAIEMKYMLTTKGRKREFTPCSTRTHTNTAKRLISKFVKEGTLEDMKFNSYGMKRDGVTTSMSNELLTGTQHRLRHRNSKVTKRYWHPTGPIQIFQYQLMNFSPGNDNDQDLDLK